MTQGSLLHSTALGHLPGYQHSGNLMGEEGKGSQHSGCQRSLNSSVFGLVALFSTVPGVPKPESLCETLYRRNSLCLLSARRVWSPGLRELERGSVHLKVGYKGFQPALYSSCLITLLIVASRLGKKAI